MTGQCSPGAEQGKSQWLVTRARGSTRATGGSHQCDKMAGLKTTLRTRYKIQEGVIQKMCLMSIWGKGLQVNNPTAQLRQVLRAMALDRFLGQTVWVGVPEEAGQDCWGISVLGQ